jgi:hypothetical protein
MYLQHVKYVCLSSDYVIFNYTILQPKKKTIIDDDEANDGQLIS